MKQLSGHGIYLLLIWLLGISILTGTSGCQRNEVTPAEIQYGKNRFTTDVDGYTREYYVHVPAGYNAKNALPVVFMLHGTSGDGEKFYNISGWKEVGEQEDILTVFPSSWHHCIVEDGEVLNTTKWNIYPGAFTYCPGEQPLDDIKFLRQVISEMEDRYTVDEKRIYLVGFSNGGQMAFRCAVEMSDVLAAVVHCSAGIPRDTVFEPKRNLPISFQLGNEDDRFFTQPVPLSGFSAGLETIPIFKDIKATEIATFDYADTYTLSGDTTRVEVATFPSLEAGGNREFNMALIEGLGHAYPNGTNHWFHGAEVHWQWLRQYSLP